MDTQELHNYLKLHPFQSDKKIAKRLKIDRQEVSRYRSLIQNDLPLPKPNPIIALITSFNKKFQTLFSSHPIFRGRLLYINLFLIALFLRLVYVFFLKKEPILLTPLLDADYYYKWATDILTDGPMTKRVFFTEPFYAYLLAFFIKIAKENGQYIMLGLQILAGSFFPIIVVKLAQKVFNQSIAVISGFIAAIYGPFIFYNALLLKTSLETFFFTLLVLVFLNTMKTNRKLYFFLTGLLLGAIATLKGNAMILVPIFFLFILLFKLESLKRKVIYCLLFFLGCIIAISPLTLHNLVVGKDFILTNYSSGMVIYGGSWWDFDGGIVAPPFVRPSPDFEEIDEYKMAEAYLGRKLKASEVNSFWISMAIHDIKSDPLRYLHLEGKKILLLITKNELSDNYDYTFYRRQIPLLKILPDFWPLSALGITAIIILFFSQSARFSFFQPKSTDPNSNTRPSYPFLPPFLRTLNSEQILIIAIVLGYSLFIITGAVTGRYRIPLFPFFAMLTSFTFWYLWHLFRTKNFNQLFVSLVVCIVLFFLTSVHLDNFDFMTDANFYNNLASYYLDRNDEENAEKYFQKAVSLDNNYAWGYGNLFSLYLKHGAFGDAKENLAKQTNLRPDDLSVYNDLKLLNELKTKPAEFRANRLKIEATKAKTEGRQDYDPDFFEYMRYFKKGDLPKAQKYLELSAKKFNQPQNTMLNLATLKKLQGDVPGAKDILEKLIRRSPDFVAANYNLANMYIKEKNWPEVAKLLQPVYDFAPQFGQGNALWYLAASYINQKEYAKATPLVKEYLQTYSQDSTKSVQVNKFKALLVPAKN